MRLGDATSRACTSVAREFLDRDVMAKWPPNGRRYPGRISAVRGDELETPCFASFGTMVIDPDGSTSMIFGLCKGESQWQ